MAITSTDLDAIFNGTGAVINTAQNVSNALVSGISDIRNIMDDTSRRNISMSQPSQVYQQPVTYGYGYSDNYNGYNGYNGYTGYSGFQNGQMNVGYPGFTNPNYGAMVGGIMSGGFNGTNGSNTPRGGNWL